MRKIKHIILHCSDSPDSMNIGFREINQWHKERGWLDKKSDISCGYHFIVRRNGKVEEGRPVTSVGAHTYGHNRMSIGICWVGRNKMTAKQDKALRKLVRRLRKEHNVNLSDVKGHCEFDSNKTCPNFDINEFRLDLLFEGLEDV